MVMPIVLVIVVDFNSLNQLVYKHSVKLYDFGTLAKCGN